MKKWIIRERESKKIILGFNDENEAMNYLRKISEIKKQENPEDWNFYELIIKYARKERKEKWKN